MMANFPVPYRVTLGDLLPGCISNPAIAALSVHGLDNSSATVETGDLFFALPGTRRDGRDYIDDAILRGAVAVVYEQSGSDAVFRKQDCVAVNQRAVPVIPVEGLAAQLARISARYFHEPSQQLHCFGITGTNGKTTSAWWLGSLLVALGKNTGLVGTLGCGVLKANSAAPAMQQTGYTTPDAIRLQQILAGFVQQQATHAVMEVSSHSLEQGRVEGLRFSSAIFTNLSRDHLDYHGSMEQYGAAKAKLFKQPGLQQAIINIDDAFGAQLADSLRGQVSPVLFTCSTHQPSADVYVTNRQVSLQGCRGELVSPWGTLPFFAPVYGEYNLANLVGVIALLCAEGFALGEVLAAVAHLDAPAGRLEKVSTTTDEIAVFVDFAHTPDALDKVLRTLKQQFPDRHLWCVFGCGGDRDSGKRALMGEVASRLADRCVITSDNPRSESPQAIISQVMAGADPATCTAIVDREAAIHHAIKHATKGDVVLLAGKGHEDYQEIMGKRLPFRDADVARQALRARGGRS